MKKLIFALSVLMITSLAANKPPVQEPAPGEQEVRPFFIYDDFIEEE